jgi:hypothetical protein
LELSKKVGQVQEGFNLEQEASCIISVKNPEKPSPSRSGRPENENRQRADLFTELRLQNEKYPTEPLFKGQWS